MDGISFTLCIGKYGGFYIALGKVGIFRICLGRIAFTIRNTDIETKISMLLKSLKYKDLLTKQ